METWKSFEQNAISHSAAHHLMTIENLLDKNGYARVTDVAKSLKITRGSASISLKALKERGLVTEDANKFLRLSKEGARISHSIQVTREIFNKFLIRVLHVEPEQAEIDACKIEHLLSEQTRRKLFHFLKYLSANEPAVDDFLNAFSEFKCSCADSPENCEICDDECLDVTAK